jgi:hypothetical protein
VYCPVTCLLPAETTLHLRGGVSYHKVRVHQVIKLLDLTFSLLKPSQGFGEVVARSIGRTEFAPANLTDELNLLLKEVFLNIPYKFEVPT